MTRYSRMLDDLGRELGTIGLSFNRSKGSVLLPPGADACCDGFTELNPTRKGLIIAGAPIGQDSYIKDFVREKTDEWLAKLPPIRQLGRRFPRAALTVCAAKMPIYLATTIPPEYTY